MRTVLALVLCAACGDNAAFAPEPHCDDWDQWGGNAAHTGQSCAAGQPLERVLADVVLDPLAPQEEKDAFGDLVIHFQAPLVAGDAVYVEVKGGTYTPCALKNVNGMIEPDCFEPDELYRLNTETWSEVRYSWHGDALLADWQFDSDWTPEPGLGFEPVFHPAIAGTLVAVPGAGGSVWELDAASGRVVRHLQPPGFDADTYVAGPITERGGSLYYNALAVDHDHPYTFPARAWLVAVDPDGGVRTASYAQLVPGAPSADAGCYTSFDPTVTPVPWPPPPNSDGTPARPPLQPCGDQLPGINSAPVFALDGSLYVVTHAQNNTAYSYLVAIDPSDLSTSWAASLRDRLDDGCDIDVTCTQWRWQRGVDPSTNLPPAGAVDDQSSSSPVVMSDGTILYGAFTGYNGVRGHLLAFTHDGRFVTSYPFGWDTTPAIAGDRVVLKDNHYFDWNVDGGPYYLTVLDRSLDVVWQFQNTETKSCISQPDGTKRCIADHPNGFEWCVNAPAVDRDGTIFANSEDGYLYAITADGALRDRFFLERSLGAAYTPLAIDHLGRIYALNNGHLIVVGGN